MPAYRSRFSDQERWMLVHFIRTLGKVESEAKPQPQKPAEEIATAVPPDAQKPVAGTNKVATSAATTAVRTPPTAEQPPSETKPPPASTPAQPAEYVSRKEYDRLKSDHEQLKKEFETIKALLNNKPQKDPAEAAPETEANETIKAIEEEMEALRNEVETSAAGTTRQLLSGFASANFTSQRHEDSAFSATFAPLFLWPLNDRILFEAELDLTLEESDTELDLKRAQIAFIVNDYVTLGAGKFLSPMNFLEDRLHQVGKLPDRPFAIRELLPESNVGLQMRGGFPLGRTRFGYAFYAANAPEVTEDDPALLGTLNFDNFDNSDGHVAVGGRVGFYPIRELEIGYGFQVSGLSASASGAGAFLQSVDLNYVRDFAALKGTLNVLAQWAWSDVDSFVYDADGSRGFGPLSFDNSRNGGYAQIAYRPTLVRHSIINRLEPIVRYERFNQRHQPAGLDETRWTIGLNYWLLPSAVLKAAYQFGEQSDDRDIQAVLFQVKVGF
jgi:hypothetical protein